MLGDETQHLARSATVVDRQKLLGVSEASFQQLFPVGRLWGFFGQLLRQLEGAVPASFIERATHTLFEGRRIGRRLCGSRFLPRHRPSSHVEDP